MNKIIDCNLQLFADGAEGYGAPSGIADGSAAYGAATDSQFAIDNAGSTDAQNADAQLEANFKAMTQGEYKDVYQRNIEKVLGKRMKSRDKQIAELNAYRDTTQSIFDKLAIKYGIEDATNYDAILKAAEDDSSYFENYAYEHNVDVETARQLVKADQIVKANDRRLAEEQEMAAFQQQYDAWMQQAAQLQQFYPNFDFDYEVNNEYSGEQFMRLLNSGVDVRTAFEVVHRDEIMGGAMQYAYNAARQETADARTARAMRPRENGTSNQQASAVVDNMSNLSKEQMDKIMTAVRNGAKIDEHNFRKYL